MFTKTIFLVLAVLVTGSTGWWWSKPKYGCSDPSKGYPYYFGTTALFCMTKKGKRAAPSRGTKDLNHRWILYRGYFFERLNGRDVYNRGFSTDSGKCSTHREKNMENMDGGVTIVIILQTVSPTSCVTVKPAHLGVSNEEKFLHYLLVC
ncbi:hypothetical protein AM593_07058, partial [Mytilus galloprovincialis]